MKLIRSHKILGFLRNGTPCCRRQKLRTHRRIQYIIKACRKLRILRCIRAVFYKMPHERFGYAGIHRIHRHMVAIVGRPSKRKLAEIAGADHDAIQHHIETLRQRLGCTRFDPRYLTEEGTVSSLYLS